MDARSIVLDFNVDKVLGWIIVDKSPYYTKWQWIWTNMEGIMSIILSISQKNTMLRVWFRNLDYRTPEAK